MSLMKIKEDEIEIIETEIKSSFAKINSCGLIGVNAYAVEIEVDTAGGLPTFILVGLPDAAINESRERVRSAIKASGHEFPTRKIVVNLAPADTKKAGPTYDLPIAIGVLANCGVINKNNLENLYIVGELGLSGKVRPLNGVLSFIILAKKKGAKGIIIPEENSHEGALIEGINIYPVRDLVQTINTINNIEKIKALETNSTISNDKLPIYQIDFSEVKGQMLAKRAFEIAASGKHHILMIGSPGSGKTMLSHRVVTILPPLSQEERIEVTQIYSTAGKLSKEHGLITTRPFRTPHHSTSTPGLIGGGSFPQPGEISLAHKGVLFLDEFTEFQKQAIDSLRQAIENKEITISRSKRSCVFPCDSMLIAACNPCPCGYYGDTIKKCKCNSQSIKKYERKISGTILDRIDLQIEVKRLTENELLSSNVSESSEKIKERVLIAREIQTYRYKKLNILYNSDLTSREMKQFCKFNSNCELILKEAIKNLGLTGRSYDRILKVSRTIADLSNSDMIKDEHILEALQFRLNTFK